MRLSRWFTGLGRLGYRHRIALAVALTLFLVICLYPFKTTILPEWYLQVVDDAGVPVREINVTEHWQHYLLESGGHEEVQRTNQDGRVSFPLRSIRASVTRRILAWLGRLTQPADRGRTDPYGAVVVWGSKFHLTTVAVYQQNEMPQPQIRVQRLQ